MPTESPLKFNNLVALAVANMKYFPRTSFVFTFLTQSQLSMLGIFGNRLIGRTQRRQNHVWVQGGCQLAVRGGSTLAQLHAHGPELLRPKAQSIRVVMFQFFNALNYHHWI